MEENKSFWKGALFGALLMLCIAAAGVIGWNLPLAGEDGLLASWHRQVQTEKKTETIQDVIDAHYLYEDEVDEDALREGMYSGYMKALGDPYAQYYPKDEVDSLMESISGTYTGIGAAMAQNKETQNIVVTWVYEDSPAAKAGLKEGDTILKVDDRTALKKPIDDVVGWIRGKENTKVTLLVQRDTEQLELTATRKKVDTPTVASEMKGEIGYIAVAQFDTVTLEQFKTALAELEAQGMKGLVIDLRGNPGGDFKTVTEMLKLLLPKGIIVSERYQDGSVKEYRGEGRQEFQKPLAVLVNKYSASASEIFSAAVQDYKTGVIVGTTTYGKGIVQNVYRLKDGSAMKLTVAEYLTPKGRSIHKKGVTPDVEVEYQPDSENPQADNQLEKALEVVREKAETENR